MVTALDVGFSYNWVIKSAEAATSDAVEEFVLPVETAGLTVVDTGSAHVYLNADNQPVLSTAGALMWDSSSSAGDNVADDAPADAVGTGEVAAEVAEGPEDGDEVALVGVELGADAAGDTVTITPDASMLADPETQFPVVVDPAYTRNGWGAVWDNLPSTSFWATKHSLGAGYEGWEQNKKVRSYFNFPTSALENRRIISAEMNVLQVHASSCTSYPTDVYRSGTASASTTWNNLPSTVGTRESSNGQQKGCSSSQPPGMVGWDVTSGVQTTADFGRGKVTFQIRGRSETDRLGWKQFEDDDAALEVVYRGIPKTPRYLKTTAGGRIEGCSTSADDPTIVDQRQVTITATVLATGEEADTNLKAKFERKQVYPADSLDALTAPESVSTYVPSDTAVSRTWTVGEYDRIYAFRASSVSYVGGSALESSTATDWCYFRAEPDPIGELTVTSASPSTKLTLCATTATTCAVAGQVGDEAKIKLSDPAGRASSYQYRFIDRTGASPATAWDDVTTSGGAERTITATPPFAQARFEARGRVTGTGTEGITTARIFTRGPAQASYQWSFADAGTQIGANTGSAASSGTPGNFSSASLTSDDRGRVGPGITFDGSQGSSSANSAVTNAASTAGNLTVSGWFRLDPLPNGAAGSDMTLVAATSSIANTFELGYEASTRSWRAGRRSPNTSSFAKASGAATRGVWTHLQATYDASTRKVVLYVNGRTTTAMSVTHPDTWAAQTQWRLGCGYLNGTDTNCATARMDEVRIWNVVRLPSESLVDATPVNGADAPIVSPVGCWPMTSLTVNGTTQSSTAEEQIYGAHLNVSTASPGLTTGADEEVSGPVLSLNGSSAQAPTMAHALVDPSGSFSIRSRVSVAVQSAAGTAVFLQQLDRSDAVLWTVLYRHLGNGKGEWVVQRGTTEYSVESFGSAANEWVTVSYDARTGDLFLRVDGSGKPSGEAMVTASPLSPTTAAGSLRVGWGSSEGSTTRLAGVVQTIQFFAGALPTTVPSSAFDPDNVDCPPAAL